MTIDIIEDSIRAVQKYQACAVGVPLKDSIKKLGREGYIVENIERTDVWQVQTPQCFSYPMILGAYEKLLQSDIKTTDDTAVVEYFTEVKVKMLMGSYENIKITTLDDLDYGEYLIKKRKENN